MNGNDMIIKEIIAMTKELKASNEKNDASHKENAVMIRELKAANEKHDCTHKEHDAMLRGLERSQRFIVSLIQDQGAQRRRDKKESERRWKEHNSWLRNHEVRLRTQYGMIRK